MVPSVRIYMEDAWLEFGGNRNHKGRMTLNFIDKQEYN